MPTPITYLCFALLYNSAGLQLSAELYQLLQMGCCYCECKLDVVVINVRPEHTALWAQATCRRVIYDGRLIADGVYWLFDARETADEYADLRWIFAASLARRRSPVRRVHHFIYGVVYGAICDVATVGCRPYTKVFG